MWVIDLTIKSLLFLITAPFFIFKGLIWMLYFQVITFLIVFAFVLLGGM